MQSICSRAGSLGIWVVLGSIRHAGSQLPRNCLYVISSRGEIVGVYDKQRLYKAEKTHYSAGNTHLVVEINGFRCGFLICYDNCFPELYEPYRDRGVGLLFHSFHNAGIGIGTPITERPSHTTVHTGPYTAIRLIGQD